jgi:serine/threonine protein kinase
MPLSPTLNQDAAGVESPLPAAAKLSTHPRNAGEKAAAATGGPMLPGYRLLEKLGEGGMGVVFRAQQEALDRLVAIKTIAVAGSDDAAARFELEARAVARLQHPNIVAVHDLVRREGRWFLIMELLEGKDLDRWVQEKGPLTEETAWRLARQVAAGLEQANRLGIVHRDVKPANILLVPAPAGLSLPAGLPLVKITDFGLALLRSSEIRPDSRLTQAGTTLGTPKYMAPEQFGRSTVDWRADLYALGVTVYHLLKGEAPYQGLTVWEIMTQKTGEDPAWDVPGVSGESLRLIADMTARDPSLRLGSYDELRERIDALPVMQGGPRPPVAPTIAFESLAEWGPEQDTPPPMGGKPGNRSGPRRRWWAWAGLAAAVPLLVLGVWAGWRREMPVVPPPMVQSGRGMPLFNGETLDGFTVGSGSWGVALDAEGGRVLEGGGMLRRPLPPFASFRLSLGVDLHKASALELHFGIRPNEGVADPHSVLLVTPDAAQLGQCTGNPGSFRPLTTPQPAPAERPLYREVAIERRQDVWCAFCDGRLVGTVRSAGAAELAEVRLITAGGPARFEALEVVELVAPG